MGRQRRCEMVLNRIWKVLVGSEKMHRFGTSAGRKSVITA